MGMTQRSIHRIEQGQVGAKPGTVRALESWWKNCGLSFEHLPDGGFRLVVSAAMMASHPGPGT
jgi:hypothetical protein